MFECITISISGNTTVANTKVLLLEKGLKMVEREKGLSSPPKCTNNE